MYMDNDEEMVDLGLEGQQWSSKEHRLVAMASCVNNPRVTSYHLLCHNVQIINRIPNEKIKNITTNQLEELGCVIS